MDEQQRRDAMETLALRDPGENGRWDARAAQAYQLIWPGKTAMLAALRNPPAEVLKPFPQACLEAARMPHGVIEGDNLPVLKRLRKRYLKRVKMIYIDPPYNTGGDFLYDDNFRARRGDSPGTDGGDEGRRHGPWLNMIYPRLVLARELLRDDGVLFVSIDDNEVHTLRLVLDEIFGAANFVAMFAWQSRTSRQNDTDLCVQHEYVVAYARRRRQAQRRLTAANEALWRTLPGFAAYPLAVRTGRYDNPDGDPRGPWKADPFDAPNVRPALTYPITNPLTGKVFLPPPGRCWRTGPERFAELQAQGRILFGRSGRARPLLKVFLGDKQPYGEVATTWLDGAAFGTARSGTRELQALFGARVPFAYPKPTALLRFLLRLATGPGDLVLDFFAGSGTTGHAVLAENLADGGGRRFLLVQRDEATGEPRWPTIADITRERLRRAARAMGSEEGFRAWRLVSPGRAGSRTGTPPR